MTSPNDWPIKKCLVLSGSLLLATLGLIGLGSLGLDIPVLRQMVAFIFLSFAPGLLLLRILRIHNVHVIESLLYSVGLSLAFVMAVGVVANFALPPLGISRPIALLPLIITMTFFLLILCILAYIRDKGFRPSSRSDNQTLQSVWQSFRTNPAPYLLAVLLPFLAILGASLVNAYQNNILIFILIFAVALIIGLVAFNKFIHTRVYAFMIFMMALALLYQTTFISDNLVGSDIHIEYYAGKVVVENGYWDASISSLVNSCLSIVMLAPIYSLLLNIDIVWLFKIVYPLLFALMPLALFRVFSLQIRPQYAFLAVVFFITLPMFTMDMVQLNRQQVSELFFVLVVLLMVDRKLTLVQRTILTLIFGFGVVVSYYGLGTGYTIGYLTLGMLVLIIIKSRPGRTMWQWLVGKARSLPADLTSAGAFNKKALAIIIGLSLVFMLGYYNVVASGASISGTNIAANIAQGTVQQIVTPPSTGTPPTGTPSTGTPSTGTPSTGTPSTGIPSAGTPSAGTPSAGTPSAGTPSAVEIPTVIQKIIARFPMLNPLYKEPLTQTALGLDFPSASPGGKVWRIFQYLVELCLIVGFFRLIFRPAALGPKLKAEYVSLTIVSAFILLGIFILPTWSYGLGATRIWQITLLLMSPLLIFGGEAIASGIARLVGVFRKGIASFRSGYDRQALLCFPVLLIMIPYFIFNSGVVFELSRSQTTYFIDVPYSIALSNYRTDVSTAFTKQDVAAADWLFKVADKNYTKVADYNGYYMFWHYENWGGESQLFPYYSDNISYPSYIYFGTWNTEKRSLILPASYAARQIVKFEEIPGLPQILDSGGIAYNDGSAMVILPSRLNNEKNLK